MSRPPWFPMYPNDYDNDTAELSLEEDGFYSRMLRRAWSKSPDGYSLPADETLLARVLGVTPRIIRRHREVTRRYFVVEGDRIISKRLRDEARKATQRSETAKVNGSLGGRPKETYSFLPANPEVNPQKSDSQSQESKNRTQGEARELGTSSGADPAPIAAARPWDDRKRSGNVNGREPNPIGDEVQRQLARLAAGRS